MIIYNLFNDLFAYEGEEELSDDQIFNLENERIKKYKKLLLAKFNEIFPNVEFQIGAVIDAKNAGIRSECEVDEEEILETDIKLFNSLRGDASITDIKPV